MPSNGGHRLSLPTIAAIAVFAFGLEPVVHEVLGHAVTCWLTGGKVLLISSTAMQTQDNTRLVPAAGPLANILFGLAAWLILRRIQRFTAARLFLWLFAFANLFLATGYILYSGLINFGDAAVVIAGLKPAWLYRAALIAIGALGYRYSIQRAGEDVLGLLRNGSLLPGDIPRIVYSSCAAGGLLFLVASFFNPVSPSLILYDGLSGAFGMTLGFLLIARIGQTPTTGQPAAVTPASSLRANAPEPAPDPVPFNLPCVAFASIFAVLFILIMGRGICFP